MELYQAYKGAGEETRKQGELPFTAAKKAAGVGLGIAGLSGGSQLASKVMSLINKHVPEDLAIKGLNKLDPRFGKFIQTALENGGSWEEAREFIGEKAQEGAEQENVKEQDNLIKKYSPELHQFIEGEIQKGRSPLEAGALAQLKPEFKRHIEKLSKDHKAPFSALLKTVYGEGGKAEAVKQYNAQKQQKQSMMQQEEERFNQQYGQGQQQQGQGLDPAVLAFMQEGKKVLQQFGA